MPGSSRFGLDGPTCPLPFRTARAFDHSSPCQGTAADTRTDSRPRRPCRDEPSFLSFRAATWSSSPRAERGRLLYLKGCARCRRPAPQLSHPMAMSRTDLGAYCGLMGTWGLLGLGIVREHVAAAPRGHSGRCGWYVEVFRGRRRGGNGQSSGGLERVSKRSRGILGTTQGGQQRSKGSEGPEGPERSQGSEGSESPGGSEGSEGSLGVLSPLRSLSPLSPLSPTGPTRTLGSCPLGPLRPTSPLSPLGPLSPLSPMSALSPLSHTSPLGFLGPRAPLGPLSPLSALSSGL